MAPAFFLFSLLTGPMTVITNLQPTTELEAVNAMLSAIGESPVSDLAGTQADLAMALNTLRNVTREVQTMRWKFNTEYGYELPPSATMVWTDTAGVVTTLNIFKPPVHLLGFETTVTSEQAGLDLVIRPSRLYFEVASIPVLVFYDRSLNRDGMDQAAFPYLYIDPIWLFDFEQLPEEARRFIYVRAARQFVQEQVGSDTLAAFKGLDEKLAFRNLKTSYGQEEDYNMITGNMSVFGALGRNRRI